MKQYKRLRQWMLLIIIGYGLIAVGRHIQGKGELYPFFIWDLFTYVPAPILQDYGLQITAINGEPLAEPIYFEQAAEYFKLAHSVEAQTMIGQLGSGLEQATPVDDVRSHIESYYLADHPLVSYALIKRTYDTIDRWKNGTFLQEDSIQTFEKGS